MSSDKNDFWDSLFDLDGDGKTTISEEWISFQIMEDSAKKHREKYGSSDSSKPSPKVYVEPVELPLPEVTSKEQLKALCDARRTDILCTILAVILMLFPAGAIAYAALAAYDPNNSASGFLAALFTIAAIVVGIIVISTASKEIGKYTSEIEELKRRYRENCKK